MKVLGFVHVQPAHGGYTHVTSTTISCRWPGTAEDWLKGLVHHNLYRAWEEARAEEDKPLSYRGARVFRVFPVAEDPERPREFEEGRLLAIWEGPL